MGKGGFKEEDLAGVVIECLEKTGYEKISSQEELGSERASSSKVLFSRRVHDAIVRLNPTIPPGIREEVVEKTFEKIVNIDAPTLIEKNKIFHQFLVRGVPIEYNLSGQIKSDLVKILDPKDLEKNDYAVVKELTIEEGKKRRRFDIVVFVNGFPLVVFELKNYNNRNATLKSAFGQLQTYKEEIPSFFVFNELLIISDGCSTRVGTLSSNFEQFAVWRKDQSGEVETSCWLGEAEGHEPNGIKEPVKEIFQKDHLLDLVSNFVLFEGNTTGVFKKIAKYHQFYGVNKALEATIAASRPAGDGRIGVVWHTQGSGKSLTMLFYIRKAILHTATKNPTIVVVTDRTDLDGQLFGTFSRCDEVLPQTPVRAKSSPHLRELLKVASGGIIFTTIQKFFPDTENDEANFPELSERTNIIVVADEAHRTQNDLVGGFARHMRDALPNASFIGFTGTPLELIDRNTKAIFGDYISVYDIRRAVVDGATVPIYYESRLAKLDIPEAEKPRVDLEFEEVTEEEEINGKSKEKLKTKWSSFETVVGSKKRIELLAKDIVNHIEERRTTLNGKVMIVGMSRRICVELHNAIISLRPHWYDADDAKGILKVVMTGSASDPMEWQEHIRNKSRRENLSNRFRDPSDPFQIVIVRDMWLTGFDAPSLHTMYLDKPMRGHGLMQTIARVNRVYTDKPGGLIVDYLGIFHEIEKAMETYTQSGGTGRVVINLDLEEVEVIDKLIKDYEKCKDFFNGSGLDLSAIKNCLRTTRYNLIADAADYISKRNSKKAFQEAVSILLRSFGVVYPHQKTISIKDDVNFFREVNAFLERFDNDEDGASNDNVNNAVKRIVSDAVVSDGIIDIFKTAGIDSPTVSIFSEGFFDKIRNSQKKNLTVNFVSTKISREIKRYEKNIVLFRSFSEMLEKTIHAYHDRTIENAKVIEELAKITGKIVEVDTHRKALALTNEEMEFYDILISNAIEQNYSEREVCNLAREIKMVVEQKTKTTDWDLRDNGLSQVKVAIKRTLKKRSYPEEVQDRTTEVILEYAKEHYR